MVNVLIVLAGSLDARLTCLTAGCGFGATCVMLATWRAIRLRFLLESHVFIMATPIAKRTGPKIRPKKPKAMTPPNTPKNTNEMGKGVPRAMSKGFKKLSTLAMANKPHATMKTAMPTSP